MKRILLLPFCLSRPAQDAARRAAAGEGYTVVVARSTARALAEVRSHVSGPETDPHIRIVGVVCFGRAKKVWLGLIFMKMWKWLEYLRFRKARVIELAWVPLTSGSKSLFGRRSCNIGRNELDEGKFQRALEGHDTYMSL